ncbi:twin-arginine translocase subunit TatC [Taibaiella lutea]|nr:twin-arginine translocase subunit TatC [Taibaiella lutea]
MGFFSNFFAKRNGGGAGEMAFTDHIEALRWHIIRSVIVIAVVSIAIFFRIEWIFTHIILGPANDDFISYRMLCKFGKMMHIDALCMETLKIRFQNNELSGQFMMSFSASFMIGFILSFPYVFWEFWKFLKPALKQSELKYARGIVFWSSLLFFIGVCFAYFLIAPFTINFFANYQLSPQFENIITIDNYYGTMSDLIFGLGIVFELPILVYFLSKIGILTPAFMREQRRIAIVIIMVVAAVITPPDWFSIFLVAIPLILLYEAGIIISARILKEKKAKEKLDW